MATLARSRRAATWLLGLLGFCSALSDTALCQMTLGSIVGRVRVANHEVPPQRILVVLEIHGAPIDSVYTDAEGTFGFHSLPPDSYYVSVDDEQYKPTRVEAVIHPTSLSPTVFVEVDLVPRAAVNEPASAARPQGGNANLTDVREYSKDFPRPALKEFERGLKADQAGKKDDAIRHYERALQIAPDFYPAHNNLGSDYLSKSDFSGARKEFEQVVKLNQSDAAGYFNLSNACILMGQIPDAKHFLGEGMRLQPDSALGHFLLGSLNIRLGKLPEAEKALRQAIQLDPVMAQPRLQLVNLLLKQGRKKDAIAELHDFLSSSPGNSFSPQAKQLLEKLEGPGKTAASAPH